MEIVETQKDKPVKCNFVLIGHVDHGKSTCGGRILVDTGTVTDNMIRKAQQEADDNKMRTWWLAYLLDESPEERSKGKTHEYIIKPINRGDHVINMIDVPGHNQFITQMIYGTSKADIVVLVCSAKPGEFEKGLKGQIYEHLVLSRCMGITNLIVAINKIDTIGWDSDGYNPDAIEKYDNVKKKISLLVKKLNFKSVDYVPISAYHGWNVVEPIYKYPSLLDIIENTQISRAISEGPKNTNLINAKCIFMNIKTIVTVGFTAVLHSGESISDCVISNMRTSNGRPFVTDRDKDYVDVTFELSENIDLESYIIIRTNESTIAIGKLVS